MLCPLEEKQMDSILQDYTANKQGQLLQGTNDR